MPADAGGSQTPPLTWPEPPARPEIRWTRSGALPPPTAKALSLPYKQRYLTPGNVYQMHAKMASLCRGSRESLSPTYTYDSQSRITSMTPDSGTPLNYGFDPSEMMEYMTAQPAQGTTRTTRWRSCASCRPGITLNSSPSTTRPRPAPAGPNSTGSCITCSGPGGCPPPPHPPPGTTPRWGPPP